MTEKITLLCTKQQVKDFITNLKLGTWHTFFLSLQQCWGPYQCFRPFRTRSQLKKGCAMKTVVVILFFLWLIARHTGWLWGHIGQVLPLWDVLRLCTSLVTLSRFTFISSFFPSASLLSFLLLSFSPLSLSHLSPLPLSLLSSTFIFPSLLSASRLSSSLISSSPFFSPFCYAACSGKILVYFKMNVAGCVSSFRKIKSCFLGLLGVLVFNMFPWQLLVPPFLTSESTWQLAWGIIFSYRSIGPLHTKP